MSDVAVRVENLSKRYRRGLPSGHDRLSEVAYNLGRALLALPRRLWRPSSPPDSSVLEERTGEFWALDDVSFEVKRGEVVGIIGRNGAGKSTLLKILSRITEPTRGRFGLVGGVSSLLEVGTGFHPELTGRENVYLNGSFLGMSRSDVRKKFDEIAAFAEIDDFLDTPVKHYSSGMQMRLGFAVAAHLQPEILIVDEVLAVGDAAFQKKCLGKMDEVSKGGRTVLFVSHNLVAVRQLCKRVVWMEKGHVRLISDAHHGCREYLGKNYGAQVRSQVWANAPERFGNEKFRVWAAQVSPLGGSTSDVISTSTPVRVELDCEVLSSLRQITVTILFCLTNGTVAFGSSLADGSQEQPFLPSARCRCTCDIPAHLLNAGELSVSLLAVREGAEVIFRCDHLLGFSVVDESDRRFGWYGPRPGVVRPRLEWSVSDATQNANQPKPHKAPEGM